VTKKVKLCPSCARVFPAEYPGALSRRDNKTEICSQCGKEEGATALMKQNNHGSPISICNLSEVFPHGGAE